MALKQQSGSLCRASPARAPFRATCSASRPPPVKQVATGPGPAAKLLSAAAAALMSTAGLANASERIAEFTASGLVFKDKVQVVAVDDPVVSGVTIYISDFERSLPDKIAKMGAEPSSASVTCAQTGPIEVRDEGKLRSKGGEEVFSESKTLNVFNSKTLRVRRIYDSKHSSLIYIAYSTRLQNDKDESPGRFKTSVCALPISAQVAPVVQSEAGTESSLFAPAQNSS